MFSSKFRKTEGRLFKVYPSKSDFGKISTEVEIHVWVMLESFILFITKFNLEGWGFCLSCLFLACGQCVSGQKVAAGQMFQDCQSDY